MKNIKNLSELKDFIIAEIENGTDKDELGIDTDRWLNENIMDVIECHDDTGVVDYANALFNFDAYDFWAGDEDGLMEYVKEFIYENQGFNVKICGCADAMRFLQVNDPSLQRSIDIAWCSGITSLQDIDSEKLASMLASQIAQNSFRIEMKIDYDEIDELFGMLEDD